MRLSDEPNSGPLCRNDVFKLWSESSDWPTVNDGDDYGDDYDDCDVFVDAGGKSLSGWFVLHF